MRLTELVDQLGGALSPIDGAGPVITGVDLDSRRIGAGDLFAALPGTRDDGLRFIADALARGAAAVLTPVALDPRLCARRKDDPADRPARAIQWIHSRARAVAGEAAALVYGEPARGMFVAAVTGTNGKTTTAHLIGHLLRCAGRRPAVLGTAGHRLADGRLRPATHTTPDGPELQRILREHRRLGGDSVALEASSHALDQDRIAGLACDVAVFTNLSRDHLDYHESLECYAGAKERLFLALRPNAWGVVNADDSFSDQMARAARSRGARVITYSAELRGDLCASQLRSDFDGTHFVLTGMGIPRAEVSLPLAGRYNVENALAAIACALLSGASPSNVLDGLATASGAPGRLERVPTGDRGFTVLIDYAHSEAALENVCRVVRSALESRTGRLILVFGCGGDRDTGKRSPMGRVANQLADIAIVTSDNPRSEDPERIIAEIRRGMHPERARCIVEPDRARAIARAVECARERDVVLIAGKGHETTQTIGRTAHEFDDRKVAAEALR